MYVDMQICIQTCVYVDMYLGNYVDVYVGNYVDVYLGNYVGK